MNTSTRTAIAATTLAVALAITGCTTTGGVPAPAPTATTSAPATPKATPVPIPGDLDGNGELSGWERDQLARGTYTLPDGTAVAIPTDAPLPALVVEAVQSAVVNAAGPPVRGGVRATSDWVFALIAAVEAQSALINRTIIPVSYAWAGDTGRYEFAVGGEASGSFHSSTSEAVSVANANSWVGDQTDKYVVIVFR